MSSLQKAPWYEKERRLNQLRTRMKLVAPSFLRDQYKTREHG